MEPRWEDACKEYYYFNTSSFFSKHTRGNTFPLRKQAAFLGANAIKFLPRWGVCLVCTIDEHIRRLDNNVIAQGQPASFKGAL